MPSWVSKIMWLPAMLLPMWSLSELEAQVMLIGWGNMVILMNKTKEKFLIISLSKEAATFLVSKALTLFFELILNTSELLTKNNSVSSTSHFVQRPVDSHVKVRSSPAQPWVRPVMLGDDKSWCTSPNTSTAMEIIMCYIAGTQGRIDVVDLLASRSLIKLLSNINYFSKRV